MKICYCLAAAAAALALLGAAPARAEGSNWSLIAAGTPLVKLDFRHDGVYVEPSFLPGPGLGYIWDKGRFGVVGFPGFFLRRHDDVILAPHVTFHAYFISAGLGYELQFARTNGGATKFREGFPIMTLGLTLPLQAWIQR